MAPKWSSSTQTHSATSKHGPRRSRRLDWLYEESDEKLVPTVRALKKADPAYDAIFIDTAGFESAMAMHAIAAANLVLIPSKATEADAKGARRTWSHIQSVAEAMEKSIPAHVVMMDVDANTNITQAIVDALDAQHVPRLRAMCAHRTGFKEMTCTGRAPEGGAKLSAQAVLAEMQSRGCLITTRARDGEGKRKLGR